MAFTLACKDFGVDCLYVARGETKEEVIQKVSKHAKEVHGFTNHQLKDPKFLEQSRKLIKKA